jgi:Zn-dependent peptidase ImmA (M78 family)
VNGKGYGKYGVSFITPEQMELEIHSLMAEYGNQHGQILEPPIPIDEITEIYLQLALDFVDTKELFGVDGVFGALWVEDQRVGIDHSLEPDSNPKMLGRYHFTLAHEVGHWRLHRRKFQKRVVTQPSLLPNDPHRPNYICRDGDNDPIELQADMFAASLLMPEAMVRRVWHSQSTNQGDPLSLDEIRKSLTPAMESELQKRLRYKSGPSAEDDAAFEVASLPMAEIFQVSAAAMRKRLQKLNLLVKYKERSLFDGLE